jgi:phage-related protein
LLPAHHRRVPAEQAPKRRWRDYRTASGRSPVRDFISRLPENDAGIVLGEMTQVRDRGLNAARHLDGPIWEVRASANGSRYRVLFAEEGSRGKILLGLGAFKKQTQKTPRREIELAQQRLGDWRGRGAEPGGGRGRKPLGR